VVKAWHCVRESGREHLRAEAFGPVLGPRARASSRHAGHDEDDDHDEREELGSAGLLHSARAFWYRRGQAQRKLAVL
jgi:hypothetical protein